MVHKELISKLKKLNNSRNVTELNDLSDFLQTNSNILFKQDDEISNLLAFLCAHLLKSIKTEDENLPISEVLTLLDLVIKFLNQHLANNIDHLKVEVLNLLLNPSHESSLTFDCALESLTALTHKQNEEISSDAKAEEEFLTRYSLMDQGWTFNLIDIQQTSLSQAFVHELAGLLVKRHKCNIEVAKWMEEKLQKVKSHFQTVQFSKDFIQTIENPHRDTSEFILHLKEIDNELNVLQSILNVPLFNDNYDSSISVLYKIGIGAVSVGLAGVYHISFNEDWNFKTIISIIRKSFHIVKQVSTIFETKSSQNVWLNFIATASRMLLESFLQTPKHLNEFFVKYFCSEITLSDISANLLNKNVLQLLEFDYSEIFSQFFSLFGIIVELSRREQIQNTEKFSLNALELLGNYTSNERVQFVLAKLPSIEIFQVISISLYKKALNQQKCIGNFVESSISKNTDNSADDTSNSTDSISDDENSSIFGTLFVEQVQKINWAPSKASLTHMELTSYQQETKEALVEITLSIYDTLIAIAENTIAEDSTLKKQSRISVLVLFIQEISDDLKKISLENEFSFKMRAVLTKVIRYVQTLVEKKSLETDTQQYLLQELSISPWTDTSFWPLYINPFILPLLIQVMESKTVQEKEMASLCIWHKLINTLVETVCNDLHFSPDWNDINKEHFDTVCFIFYYMSLMQKKSILLLTAGAVIRGAATIQKNFKVVTHQQTCLFVRLLSLLDFIMHHLYTPPNTLLKDIHGFVMYELSNKSSQENRTFYEMYAYEQDNKKLDGLAWSFLLCTPEKLKYELLLQALNEMVSFPINFSKSSEFLGEVAPIESIVFGCWNLLHCLPPIPDQFSQGNKEEITIFNSIWFLRQIQPSSQNQCFAVNSLIKQGIHSNTAEQIWMQHSESMNKQQTIMMHVEAQLSQLLHRFANDCVITGDFVAVDSIFLHLLHLSKTNSDWIYDTNIEHILFKSVQLLQLMKDHLMIDLLSNASSKLPASVLKILIEIGDSPISKSLNLSMIYSSVGIQHKMKLLLEVDAALHYVAEDGSGLERSFEQTAKFHLYDVFKTSRFKASTQSLIAGMKSIARTISILSIYNFQQEAAKQLTFNLVSFTIDESCGFIKDIIKESILKLLPEQNCLSTLTKDLFLSKAILLYSYVLASGLAQHVGHSNSFQDSILAAVLNFWEDITDHESVDNAFNQLNKENIIFSFVNTTLSHKNSLQILKIYKRFSHPVNLLFEDVSASKSRLVFSWMRHLAIGPTFDKANKLHRLEADLMYDNVEKHLEFLSISDFENGTKVIKLFFHNHMKKLPFKVHILLSLLDVTSKLFSSFRNKLLVNKHLDCLLQLTTADPILSDMVSKQFLKWLLLAKNAIQYELITNGCLQPTLLNNSFSVLSKFNQLFTPCSIEKFNPNEKFLRLNDSCAMDYTFEEEERVQYESDDESILGNVCTFVSTQKDFVNQHWYYCYTCKMTDGIGVCSVCVQVCHKDHDVSYAKYGNFFCDCGAKEDKSCLALNSSKVSKHSNQLSRNLHQEESSALKDEESKDGKPTYYQSALKVLSVDKLSMIKCFLEICDHLKSLIVKLFQSSSSLECYNKLKMAVNILKKYEKTISAIDTLTCPFGSSKEGMLESFKSTFTGDHGVIVRQMLSSISVHRTVCSNSDGNHSFLLTAQDKGKINIYQLSNFLRQVTNEKHAAKWSLLKTNSLSVPCTIMSVSMIDDFLAISGIREVHVIQVSSIIAPKQHKVILPVLDGSNFIKNSVWIPESSNLLAIITAEDVQIFDIFNDLSVPQHSFLLPDGKVKECTFASIANTQVMFIMSSSGHIYYQQLSSESNGQYYVTNVLDNYYSCLDAKNGTINSGGFSIYYSHQLDLLFASFINGKNMAISFDHEEFKVRTVTELTPAAVSRTSSKNANQPLQMWCETIHVPGLVFAMYHHINQVVVLFIKPTQIFVQEIRHKAKVIDFVTIQGTTEGEKSKILLMMFSDDGSVHVYQINNALTNFWLLPQLQSKCSVLKNHFKNIDNTFIKGSEMSVNFFEHCSLVTDIEFGGSDLLQIYNTQQIKHRLSTNGLYVACANPNGFTLSITNLDETFVLTGVRILVGVQGLNRVPKSITIRDRTITLNPSQVRWYDIPLSIDEVLQEEKSISIQFSSSGDPENVTIIDSVKVYGVPREQFGKNCNINRKTYNPISEYDVYHLKPNSFTSILEKLTEVLSNLLQFKSTDCIEQVCLIRLIGLLPTIPVPISLQENIFKMLFNSTDDEYIEKIKINQICENLNEIIETQNWNAIDPENVYRMLIMLHNSIVYHVAKKKYYNEYKKILNKLVLIIKHLSKTDTSPLFILKSGLIHADFILQVVLQLWTLNNKNSKSDGIIFDLAMELDAKLKYFVKQSAARLLRAKNSSKFYESLIGNKLGFQIIKSILDELGFDDFQNLSVFNVIPLMQMMTTATLSLNTTSEEERRLLNKLIQKLCQYLHLNFSIMYGMNGAKTLNLCNSFVILKFFTIILTAQKPCIGDSEGKDKNTVSTTRETAKMLVESGYLKLCLLAVKSTIPVLNQSETDVENLECLSVSDESMLSIYSPFGDKRFLNKRSSYVLSQQAILEPILRVTYYMLKISEIVIDFKTFDTHFSDKLRNLLCKILALKPNNRRTIRKTLLLLCGDKESYKLLKDKHFFNAYFKTAIEEKAHSEKKEPIVEGLKNAFEIAQIRPGSWQMYCLDAKNSSILTVLLKICCTTEEEKIQVYIMKLFRTVLSANETEHNPTSNDNASFVFKEHLTQKLIEVLVDNHKGKLTDLLSLFIIKFLINPVSKRLTCQAHQIVLKFLGKTNELDSIIFNVITSIFESHEHGALTSIAFMDLFSAIILQEKFFLLCDVSNEKKNLLVKKILQLTMSFVDALNNHPNVYVYSYLHQLLETHSYFFDHKICLSCNRDEVPFSNIKLTGNMKADSRYTSSTFYIKLVQTYCISQITLRITDIKKAKMIKKIKFFYCNKSVQSIVELKASLSYWKLAKVVQLEAGQTEVKIDFTIPIIASNLMIEYSEFYKSMVGCADTIQCPRCSAVVSSNPGMCGNCGENVFQCHKCRAINYDEKDPFICNSCGFSKYGKFDYTLLAKPSYEIDNIENEEERGKVSQNLQTLMEKYDRAYKQIQASKRLIEIMLFNGSINIEKFNNESNINTNLTYLNQSNLLIAQKYTVDCKSLFEEMCILSTKILIHKRILLCYDEKRYLKKSSSASYEKCYRCLLKKIEELLKLTKSLKMSDQNLVLSSSCLIQKLLGALHCGPAKWQVNIIACTTFMINNMPDDIGMVCGLVKSKIETLIDTKSSCLNVQMSVKGELQMLESLAINAVHESSYNNILKTIMWIIFQSLRSNQSMFVVVSITLKTLLAVISVPTYQAVSNKIVIERNRKADEALSLKEKYFYVWSSKVNNQRLKETSMSWFEKNLFNAYSSESRQLGVNILAFLFKLLECKSDLLQYLSSIVFKISIFPQSSSELVFFFKNTICQTPWLQVLVLNGFMKDLLQGISDELEDLLAQENGTCQFASNDGIALEKYIEIFYLFWENARIQEYCKTKVLHNILKIYLDLKTITYQRNLRIEGAEAILLKILEDLTINKAKDAVPFIKACMKTLKMCVAHDLKRPLFLLEHLLSILQPEENDIKEFLIVLEKDPQQEDFLQGRMLGNPYLSTEASLGPLMRDIKNKICRECELLALLEDENGMELLVCNRILNLNLSVKDVYKKVWAKEHANSDAMKIMYRMRGLLGDATEEFIEAFEEESNSEEELKRAYFFANFIAEDGGLNFILNYFDTITNPSLNFALHTVIVKILLICVKVETCAELLYLPQTRACAILLRKLQHCIALEDSLSSLVLDLIEIVDAVLLAAINKLSLDAYTKFVKTFDTKTYIIMLLNFAEVSKNLNKKSKHFKYMSRLIANLACSNEQTMSLTYYYFVDAIAFEKYEFKPNSANENKIELFCEIILNIASNDAGNLFRDFFIKVEVVEKTILLLINEVPFEISNISKASSYLKHFAIRPHLKYILKILAGLAQNHDEIQIQISKNVVPLLHTLEQVSTEENIGILAENLLEILCLNPVAVVEVETARNKTKAEKKRMAMATREKQLHSLGMKANEKGQVILSINPIREMDVLKDENGLFCFICREGYNCQPNKILGIYTFSKKTVLEEFELQNKPKIVGHSTVTVLNIIHVDCHVSAIRLARGRDEWESASFQNTNTKCNGILPLWGPDVPESTFAACVNRQQGYIREATQCGEVNFTSCIHDLKLLVQKFAFGKSFCEDSGGGGPLSNMSFIPYKLFYAIYLALSSETLHHNIQRLDEFLNEKSSRKWIMSSYQVDGPFFFMISSLALLSYEKWKFHRVTFIKRLITVANARHFSATESKDSFEEYQKTCLDFSVYKPFLLGLGMVDLLYSYFENVSTDIDNDWPIKLVNYVRNNDTTLMRLAEKVLTRFNEDLLPCSSFEEFCDVTGLLQSIEQPHIFIENTLKEIS